MNYKKLFNSPSINTWYLIQILINHSTVFYYTKNNIKNQETGLKQ